MLFIVFLAILIAIFKGNKSVKNVRSDLFLFSILLSLFFFSSADPIVGMPLYIYPLLINIVLSVVFGSKLNKQAGIITVLLVIVLLVPIFRLAVGGESGRYFLIKESTTDVLNISGQLLTPQFNFSVIKHMVFLLVYILALTMNVDFIRDRQFTGSLISRIISIYKILFVGIIIEWVTVNALNGLNDRSLMGWIFSIKTVNQNLNWKTWGSYSVSLWFTERSNYNIVALFYMLYFKKRILSSSDWFWLILSIIALYCTGSSSCLIVLLLYFAFEVVLSFLSNKSAIRFGIVFLISCVCLLILHKNFELFLHKIRIFFEQDKVWSSGYFRINSIMNGMEAVKKHVFFGVGIGTVLVHSMMIQTVANIGIIGMILTLLIHVEICPVRFNVVNIFSMVYIVCLSFGCYMVQNFTSPFLLMIFIILAYREDIPDDRSYPKKNSLLLVRRKTFV